MSELVAIILAAGKGTRMRSKYPKVLHKVGGKPMLQHVIDAASAAGADKKVVIVGHEAELVEAMVGNQGTIALQAEQLGTGHAVMQTADALKDFHGTALILCGDTPLLDGEELKNYWFAGFYPAEKPRWTIVVMQDAQTEPEVSSAAVFARLCDALSAGE